MQELPISFGIRLVNKGEVHFMVLRLSISKSRRHDSSARRLNEEMLSPGPGRSAGRSDTLPKKRELFFGDIINSVVPFMATMAGKLEIPLDVVGTHGYLACVLESALQLPRITLGLNFDEALRMVSQGQC
jgi:hypothetical protein